MVCDGHERETERNGIERMRLEESENKTSTQNIQFHSQNKKVNKKKITFIDVKFYF